MRRAVPLGPRGASTVVNDPLRRTGVERVFALGVNPWVWTSPVTDEALDELVPKLAGWGFDAVELPVENVGDWTPHLVADLLRRHAIAPASVIAVTSPGRELVDAGAD